MPVRFWIASIHIITEQQSKQKANWMHLANTFFTTLAFVSGVANTGAHDARAMVIAGDINTLVGGDITLRSLPATVAQAPSFHVLPVSTAQHWAGCYGRTTKNTLKQMENHFEKEHKSPACDIHSLYTVFTRVCCCLFCQNQIFYMDDAQLVNCILPWVFKTKKKCP